MTTQQVFLVRGMDCPSCAQHVEDSVRQLGGVQHCELHFATEKLRVAGNVESAAIIQQIEALGYTAVHQDAGRPALPPAAPRSFLAFLAQRVETRFAALGALLILPGLFLEELAGMAHPLIALLSAAALAAAGWPIARSGWRTLRTNRTLNINALMTIAAVGAVLIGETTEAAMVMVLFALGEALEGYTTGRAREAIRSLMALAPATALRLARESSATAAEVPVEQLALGDHILVKPGQRIPMDGVVVAGLSAVNQAPITGESLPVDKEPGATVFAGSVNGTGALEIRITHVAADNTISRIIRLVEEAQEQRAPAQRLVDRFAQIYTPAVVLLAALVAVLPPLLLGQPLIDAENMTAGWLYRGLALLVVACPCALVISTPVTIISAISTAARRGVLFKGGATLEALSQVATVAFDKTGTLTVTKPVVTRIACAAALADQTAPHASSSCPACQELLALTAAVERHSEHPLAQAVGAAASAARLAERYPAAAGVTTVPGRGVTGSVGGRLVLAGSQALVPAAQVSLRDGADAPSILVSVDEMFLGAIWIADTVRPHAAASVAALHRAGLRTVLLSGDRQSTALAVAQQVGIEDVRAQLLPGDKLDAVRALQQHGALAMVGDGINDAPALAAADVGIALGAAQGGTAQAMETADVTLMSDDLRRLPEVLQLSKVTRRTILFNIAASLAIKLLFMAVVLAGLGTMWMAVLADMGTSLLVTLNGMRLLRWRGT